MSWNYRNNRKRGTASLRSRTCVKRNAVFGACFSATKKEPKPKVLSPDIPSGGGVFHMNGWGPKSSVCPSKPGKIKLFWRDIPGFCWDIPAAPEKFEKKKFVFNFWPLVLRVFLCIFDIKKGIWYVSVTPPRHGTPLMIILNLRKMGSQGPLLPLWPRMGAPALLFLPSASRLCRCHGPCCLFVPSFRDCAPLEVSPLRCSWRRCETSVFGG